jgi:hypothetical protein
MNLSLPPPAERFRSKKGKVWHFFLIVRKSRSIQYSTWKEFLVTFSFPGKSEHCEQFNETLGLGKNYNEGRVILDKIKRMEHCSFHNVTNPELLFFSTVGVPFNCFTVLLLKSIYMKIFENHFFKICYANKSSQTNDTCYEDIAHEYIQYLQFP